MKEYTEEDLEQTPLKETRYQLGLFLGEKVWIEVSKVHSSQEEKFAKLAQAKFNELL